MGRGLHHALPLAERDSNAATALDTAPTLANLLSNPLDTYRLQARQSAKRHAKKTAGKLRQAAASARDAQDTAKADQLEAEARELTRNYVWTVENLQDYIKELESGVTGGGWEPDRDLMAAWDNSLHEQQAKAR